MHCTCVSLLPNQTNLAYRFVIDFQYSNETPGATAMALSHCKKSNMGSNKHNLLLDNEVTKTTFDGDQPLPAPPKVHSISGGSPAGCRFWQLPEAWLLWTYFLCPHQTTASWPSRAPGPQTEIMYTSQHQSIYFFVKYFKF